MGEVARKSEVQTTNVPFVGAKASGALRCVLWRIYGGCLVLRSRTSWSQSPPHSDLQDRDLPLVRCSSWGSPVRSLGPAKKTRSIPLTLELQSILWTIPVPRVPPTAGSEAVTTVAERHFGDGEGRAPIAMDVVPVAMALPLLRDIATRDQVVDNHI
jgi:hypothetical protein